MSGPLPAGVTAVTAVVALARRPSEPTASPVLGGDRPAAFRLQVGGPDT